MKILVTGGAGFIGSHIVDHYIAAGHEVSIIDNFWEEGGGKGRNVNPQAKLYRVDISDRDALQTIFEDVQPEIVNHHAAQHSVAISTKDPYLDVNVNILGLLNVLTDCSRVGTRKIIFSSGATYGTPESLPIDEKLIQKPESPYGITKMTSEHYLRYWQATSDLAYTIFRYGNVFGPRQDPNGEAGVVAIFAKRFLTQESIRIDWDGEQCKDYVYVEDVAAANVLALNHGDNDVFCVATETGTSVNQIYMTLANITGYKPPIIRASKRPGDIYRAYFDCSKARQILGWTPSVSFEEGAREVVEYFKS